MYKIINKCNTVGGCPYQLCRVWFSLIPNNELKCKAGDPIRVEWVTISGTPRKNDKNESISVSATRQQDGSIKIPNFNHEGSIIQGGELFNYSNLDPSVIGYWESWVRENRPC